MKLRTLFIIEDLNICNHLQTLFEKHFGEVVAVDRYFPSTTNAERLKAFLYDFVFCDVDIANHDPFELISSIQLDQSRFIFISSKDNPILNAVQFAKFNYLLKPIKLTELKTLMNKLSPYFQKKSNHKAQVPLLNGKISLAAHKGYTFVDLNDIMYITSSGNYSTVFLANKESVTLTKLIGEFEQMLSEFSFVRTHQSFIVNINHIAHVVKEDGWQIILANSEVKIPVARRRKEKLCEVLGI